MSRIAEESGGALKRASLFAAAGLLALAAVIFTAAAIVVAASSIMPDYAAILVGAAFLFVLASGAGLIAKRKIQIRGSADASDVHPAENGGAHVTSLLERHSLDALTSAAAARPGKTLLAGLAAGATLGVLEALDRRSRR